MRKYLTIWYVAFLFLAIALTSITQPATVKLQNSFKFLSDSDDDENNARVPRFSHLPESVLRIGRASKSPLTFTQHVLDRVCGGYSHDQRGSSFSHRKTGSVVPPSHFRKLKLFCLLSLVSLGSSLPDTEILSVVVLGTADSCLDRLLRYLGSLKSLALWNQVNEQSLFKSAVALNKSEQFLASMFCSLSPRANTLYGLQELRLPTPSTACSTFRFSTTSSPGTSKSLNMV